MIRVLVYEPGKNGEVREIENALAPMHKIVGGYIERVCFSGAATHNYALVCNEDGHRLGLPENRGVVGTFFLAREVVVSKYGETEFASLTDEDVVYWRRVFDRARYS